MSYPRRLDSLEARRARRPADAHPLAGYPALEDLEPGPERDLIEAIREHTGKPHTEATEAECLAALWANPDVLERCTEALLDEETERESRDADGVLHPNIYTRQTEES